jgi:hypothetical protein
VAAGEAVSARKSAGMATTSATVTLSETCGGQRQSDDHHHHELFHGSLLFPQTLAALL